MGFAVLRALLLLGSLFQIAFDCFLSTLVPFLRSICFMEFERLGLLTLFLMNVFLFQMSALLNLSAPQFSHLKNMGHKRAWFMESLGGLIN